LTTPDTQFSAASAGAVREILIFSGRIAAHTTAPGAALMP
jgi:hypothetical protein